MENETTIVKNSRALTITGWVLSVLAIIFLLMDALSKVAKPDFIVELNQKLGFGEHLIVPLAIVLLVATIIYAIPQTAILGAVLLTGYLGGAVATHVRVSVPENNQGFGGEPFSIIFPVILGLFIWGGLYFRDKRLRALIPMRK